MKKSSVVFILLILFCKMYSQEDSIKFKLPGLDIDYFDFKVELPRVKIQNKSLVNVLVTNVVKERRNHSKAYLLDIREDKLNGHAIIIVIDYMISMLGFGDGIGFFYLEDCLFLVKGDNPDNLYSIEQEKRSFEYSKPFRCGVLMPFPMIWDPRQWTFIYEKGKVKLLECEHFN